MAFATRVSGVVHRTADRHAKALMAPPPRILHRRQQSGTKHGHETARDVPIVVPAFRRTSVRLKPDTTSSTRRNKPHLVTRRKKRRRRPSRIKERQRRASDDLPPARRFPRIDPRLRAGDAHRACRHPKAWRCVSRRRDRGDRRAPCTEIPEGIRACRRDNASPRGARRPRRSSIRRRRQRPPDPGRRHRRRRRGCRPTVSARSSALRDSGVMQRGGDRRHVGGKRIEKDRD